MPGWIHGEYPLIFLFPPPPTPSLLICDWKSDVGADKLVPSEKLLQIALMEDADILLQFLTDAVLLMMPLVQVIVAINREQKHNDRSDSAAFSVALIRNKMFNTALVIIYRLHYQTTSVFTGDLFSLRWMSRNLNHFGWMKVTDVFKIHSAEHKLLKGTRCSSTCREWQ